MIFMTDYVLRDFVNKAISSKKTVGDVIFDYELKHFKRSKKEVSAKLKGSFSVFRNAIKCGLEGKYKFKNLMFSEDAKKMNRIKVRILGNTLHKACTYALAITENNLNMGQVIACPTAGASGIVPACIIAIAEDYGLSEEIMHKALLTASAVELSIVKNASISGAADGCQAECGSATAMAAAAIVQLMNSHANTNPEMVENAAALALKNMLGLVCDPVAGLVSVPCRKRNSTCVGVAFVAAQMAMSGIRSYIPFDEVVTAMDLIGDSMSEELKETARGGLAKTPSGKKWDSIKDKFLKEAKEKKMSFADVLYKNQNQKKSKK
jgi:L-serine dehydratase